jgi:hypothetical protein
MLKDEEGGNFNLRELLGRDPRLHPLGKEFGRDLHLRPLLPHAIESLCEGGRGNRVTREKVFFVSASEGDYCKITASRIGAKLATRKREQEER